MTASILRPKEKLAKMLLLIADRLAAECRRKQQAGRLTIKQLQDYQAAVNSFMTARAALL